MTAANFWIPVKESLPEEGIAVLLIFIGDELQNFPGEALNLAVRENGRWCYTDGEPLPDYYIPLYYAIIPPCPWYPDREFGTENER